MPNFGRFLDGRIPEFRRIAGNQAMLLADFRYEDPEGLIHVAQKGMTYDGGSIPRLFWGLSTHPWADDVIGPATIHDWYCQLGRDKFCCPYDSERVHYLFYLGLRCIGVPDWRARSRWLAVRTRGPKFPAVIVPDADGAA
jgi:hypothetical protein